MDQYDVDVAKNLMSMVQSEVPDFKEEWELDIVTLSEVKPEKVDWRWKDKLAKGKAAMLIGDPEAGKTFLTLGISTAMTRGNPLPPDVEKHEPQNVLLLSGEDGIADTIVPRLIEMGANMERVKQLKGLKKTESGDIRTLDLRTDLQRIDRELSKGGYGMVVIDPINAYTPEVDAKADVSVRTMLRPIGELAERHQVILLLVRHLNKNERAKVMYRSLDSIGYVAFARAVLLVGKNPDDEDESVVVVIKSSVAKKPKGISFRLDDGVFKWGSVSHLTADQLLSNKSDEEKSAVDEAGEFLIDLLEQHGGWLEQGKVILALRKNGISEPSARRAKKKYHIESKKEGDHWNWEIVSKKGNMLNKKDERLEQDEGASWIVGEVIGTL